MLPAELLHDHRLTHAAVTVNGNAGHPSGARMIEEAAQDLQHMAGTRIVNPAFATDRAYSIGIRLRQ